MPRSTATIWTIPIWPSLSYLNSLFWKGETAAQGREVPVRPGCTGTPTSAESGAASFLAAGFERIGGACVQHAHGFPCRCVCGQARVALFVLLSVSTYARPSELLRCVTRCLVETHRFSSGRVGSPVGADLSSRRRPRQASSTFPCLWTALT